MSKYSLLFAILFLGAAATPVYAADSKSEAGAEQPKSKEVTKENECVETNALVKAASEGDTKKVLELIKNGADIQQHVVCKDDLPLNAAVKSGNIKTVKALLEAGADVNAKDKYGYTALMWANDEHKEIAELLISNGAKVNMQDKDCYTALDYAKDEKMIKYLKSEGAKKGSQIEGCKANTTKKQTVKH